MQTILEFFTRLVGPILFATGITLFLMLYQLNTEYYNTANQDYAMQSVVSQNADETSQNRMMRYADVISMVAGGPTVDTMISVPSAFYWALVRVGVSDYVVVVMERDKVIFTKTIPKSDWDTGGFPYHSIPNFNYRRIETYNRDGSTKNITYVKAGD